MAWHEKRFSESQSRRAGTGCCENRFLCAAFRRAQGRWRGWRFRRWRPCGERVRGRRDPPQPRFLPEEKAEGLAAAMGLAVTAKAFQVDGIEEPSRPGIR